MVKLSRAKQTALTALVCAETVRNTTSGFDSDPGTKVRTVPSPSGKLPLPVGLRFASIRKATPWIRILSPMSTSPSSSEVPGTASTTPGRLPQARE